MKRCILLFTIIACGALYAQEKQVTSTDISKMHDALPDKEFTVKTIDTSFVAPSGERVLRQEIIVPATLDEVWQVLSTADGLRTWMAPVVDMQLKTGGHWWANYDPAAKITDPSTIHNTVLGYVPMKMISVKIGIAPPFFPKGPSEDGTLFAVLTLDDLGNRQVRVTEHMVGIGPGEDWNKIYRFFETGNAYTLGQLVKRFQLGPRDWSAK